jgi:hypothetical protein
VQIHDGQHDDSPENEAQVDLRADTAAAPPAPVMFFD